jgi:hypothetical protein
MTRKLGPDYGCQGNVAVGLIPVSHRENVMKLLRLSFFGLMLLLQGCPAGPRDRSKAFQAQVKAGEPLVEAIEAFRRDTGQYPASLPQLAPKYLPEVASDVSDRKHKFSGWEYLTDTNYDRMVSYSLYYYMGKGAVMYQPTNWISDDDGHREIISVDP